MGDTMPNVPMPDANTCRQIQYLVRSGVPYPKIAESLGVRTCVLRSIAWAFARFGESACPKEGRSAVALARRPKRRASFKLVRRRASVKDGE